MTLGKSGRFHKGIGVELLGLGPVFVRTRFESGTGLAITTAMQIDLGTRWALRLPLAIEATVQSDGHEAYSGAAFSPGALYRWRDRDDQRWVPFLGAGLRLVAGGVRRDFLGEPLVTTSALHIGHHFFGEHHIGDGDSGSVDPNVDDHSTAGPELWAGTELHVSRWVALIFSGTYAFMRMDGEDVHLLRATIAGRITL